MEGQKRQVADFVGLGKIRLAGLAFSFAFAIGWVGTPNASAQTAPEANSRPAEQVYKNIQVFKGVPADQVLPLMQLIAGSLGVHCGLCHHQDEAKRDDDSKPQKLLARKMIQMVFDINKNTFGGRKVVSCYTCHRGSTNVTRSVAFEPELHTPAGRGEAPPAGAAGPTADEILGKYMAAIGGADAVGKVASVVQKGTMTESEIGEKPTTMMFESFAKAPGKYAAVTHMKNGDTVGVYNGDAGWFLFSGTRMFLASERIWDFSVPYEPARAMRPEELDAAQLGDILYLGGRIKQAVTGLRASATVKIGDQEAYTVSGRTKNLPGVKLYFYKESGLLARLTYDVETPVGYIPHQIDYADYRDVDGVKMPFQWTNGDIREPQYIFKMTEVRQNVAIDDSRFAKPVAPPAAR